MATIIKKGASKAEIRARIHKAVQECPSKSILKLAGSLKARLNPLEYQKKLRDEWE